MEIAGICFVPLSFLAPFLGRVTYTVSTLLLWRGNKLPLLLMVPSGNASHSSCITFLVALFFSSSDWWVWKENLPMCRPAPALSPQDLSAYRKRVLSVPPGHESTGQTLPGIGLCWSVPPGWAQFWGPILRRLRGYRYKAHSPILALSEK